MLEAVSSVVQGLGGLTEILESFASCLWADIVRRSSL
jgi:hypothetical protein